MLADGLAGIVGFFAAGLDVAVPVIFTFFCPYIGIICFPFFSRSPLFPKMYPCDTPPVLLLLSLNLPLLACCLLPYRLRRKG